MNARMRPAAAALALTISLAGATAVNGAISADATPAVHPRAAAKAAPLVVDITVGKDGITRSVNRFRPGNTLFSIRSAGLRGSIELVRLRHGYTLKMLRRDLGKTFSGDLEALRRVDHRAVFYGGMPVRRHKATQFGTRLGAGKYFLVNLDRDLVKPLVVTGAPEARSLPAADGVLNMVPPNRFRAPGPLPASGWLKQTNKSDEPHFTILNRVKASTTARKVRKFFAAGEEHEPSWALDEARQSLLISPGHTFRWHYDLSGGKYLALCFWPDDETGMPHAAMGMWHLYRLG